MTGHVITWLVYLMCVWRFRQKSYSADGGFDIDWFYYVMYCATDDDHDHDNDNGNNDD